jgi:aminoglycoside phosphotransferase (APT) family kinase protein
VDASRPVPIPLEVDELDAAWFAAALRRDVTATTVTDRDSGTTGRARVQLTGSPDVPATVFVKLAPFDELQRGFVDMLGMGVAEARFYRDLAAEVPVRVPSVWFADTEDGRYVMVLEDLTASGCRFPKPNESGIEGRARDIVEQLAALHAAYWESERFAPGHDLDWLSDRDMSTKGGGQWLVRQAVEVIGDRMDDRFHRVADVFVARADDIGRLWSEGATTLIHGDPHLGNLFVDRRAGDRTGFLDWAVLCRAPGIRDVAYVLTNSIPEDVRERIERELVDRYCEIVLEAGVDIDPASTWDQYRLFAIYSWVAAVSTAGMGSKWQPIDIGISSTLRATAAVTHLDSIGLVESRLG